jgi:pimeloyl-ACP methyl ester carboxylesterase
MARTYSSDPGWAKIMDRDVARTALEAFFASIGSLRTTDLRADLPRINVPVLGMYGARDNVVDSRQRLPLAAGVRNAQIEHFPTSGHFIMLDQPVEFVQKLRFFLDEPLNA